MKIAFFKKIIPETIRRKMRNFYDPFFRKIITLKVKKFYSSFISPGDLVFDIGAFKGDFTKAFRKLGAKVIAVEPQSELMALLKRRFKADEKTVLINKGISNKTGTLTININEKDRSSASFLKNWRKIRDFDAKEITKTETVKLTTLDNLIKKYGTPKLIKIDVEGYEKHVLQGLSKKIDFISFEFSGNTYQDTELCIKELLKKNKNAKFKISYGEDFELVFKDWETSDKILSYLKNHPELNGDIHVKN